MLPKATDGIPFPSNDQHTVPVNHFACMKYITFFLEPLYRKPFEAGDSSTSTTGGHIVFTARQNVLN